LREAYVAAEAGRQAEHMLAATIAKEVQAPIGRIAAVADAVLRASLPESAHASVAAVRSLAESLLARVEELLEPPEPALASGDHGGPAFRIRESVGTMLKSVAWRAHEKGVELAYEVGATVPETLRGDLRALRRVMMTLVGNAIRFTDDGEVTVHVHAARADDATVELHVTVADTGVGMTAARQRVISDELARAGDGPATPAWSGSDLERAVRLVRRLGGRLWLETGPAEGSVFHFTARFADTGIPSAEPPAAELHDVAVLVVEDHPTTRRVLVETLSAWGMRPAAVEGVALAEAAIESARAAGRPFEFVLIDERAASADGNTLAERLRGDASFGGTLIGLLDGDGAAAGAAWWTEIGATACLTKPVTPSELRHALTMKRADRMRTATAALALDAASRQPQRAASLPGRS
jgi:CheY-like chemotaxis protein